MKRKTQPFLPGLSGEFANPRSHHGGEYSVGRRKRRRPISFKRPMHIVMRASGAVGSRSLRNPKNFSRAVALLKRYATNMGVRIYRHAIVGNHIHIILRVRRRESLQNFLRAFAGNLACYVLGAKRSAAKGKFWDLLAFSRLIEWGRDYKGAVAYVLQNEMEASGILTYKTRKKTKTFENTA